MKWHSNGYAKPGTTRIVTRWLLFPRDIEGETRWLGWASWKQEYVQYWGWTDLFWIG